MPPKGGEGGVAPDSVHGHLNVPYLKVPTCFSSSCSQTFWQYGHHAAESRCSAEGMNVCAGEGRGVGGVSTGGEEWHDGSGVTHE